MQLEHQIADFLEAGPFAVVGASPDRSKYGNKVLRCCLQHEMHAVPVNPNAAEVEGISACRSLSEMQPVARSVSIITPPPVTERVVAEALELGIRQFWMQPGAESAAAVAACKAAGANVISGGPCLLVVLGYHEAP
ncbi:MAG: CoA-binding protein [Planctomycetaceae bacterium]